MGNMKNFIKQYREYKKLEFSPKFVWNPETQKWLYTSFFTTEYITKRGLEVVRG